MGSDRLSSIDRIYKMVEALQHDNTVKGDPVGKILAELDELRSRAAPPSSRSEMREALEAARQFIVNGVELGYIHIPKNDPAEHTLGKINAALKES